VAVAETATTKKDAAAAAERIGFPVVMKAIGSGIVHKSDRGGVKLNLRNAHHVASAFEQLTAAYGEELAAVLLQKQHEGVAEIILGMLYDRVYGPFVMVGSGGIHAELLDDTRFAPAPISVEAAHEMLRSLRLYPLLDGARGRPKADVDSVVAAIVAVSRLASTLGARLPDFEINPLIVGRQGEGCVAVDIRTRLD
jgi:succinyl-CoA synthetase beta subunit